MTLDAESEGNFTRNLGESRKLFENLVSNNSTKNMDLNRMKSAGKWILDRLLK